MSNQCSLPCRNLASLIFGLALPLGCGLQETRTDPALTGLWDHTEALPSCNEGDGTYRLEPVAGSNCARLSLSSNEEADTGTDIALICLPAPSDTGELGLELDAVPQLEIAVKATGTLFRAENTAAPGDLTKVLGPCTMAHFVQRETRAKPALRVTCKNDQTSPAAYEFKRVPSLEDEYLGSPSGPGETQPYLPRSQFELIELAQVFRVKDPSWEFIGGVTIETAYCITNCRGDEPLSRSFAPGIQGRILLERLRPTSAENAIAQGLGDDALSPVLAFEPIPVQNGDWEAAYCRAAEVILESAARTSASGKST